MSPTIRDRLVVLLCFALALVALFLSGGCGAVADGGARAVVVSSPLSGYRCFAILDGQDRPVGGNCVAD